MFQVYLLTVVTNILAGLALANGFLQQRFDRFADYTGFMANKVYRVVLGAITFLIGNHYTISSSNLKINFIASEILSFRQVHYHMPPRW